MIEATIMNNVQNLYRYWID